MTGVLLAVAAVAVAVLVCWRLLVARRKLARIVEEEAPRRCEHPRRVIDGGRWQCRGCPAGGRIDRADLPDTVDDRFRQNLALLSDPDPYLSDAELDALAPSLSRRPDDSTYKPRLTVIRGERR